VTLPLESLSVKLVSVVRTFMDAAVCAAASPGPSNDATSSSDASAPRAKLRRLRVGWMALRAHSMLRRFETFMNYPPVHGRVSRGASFKDVLAG
jgi:hypothetical protein